jgi:hypothetical protein
MSCGANDVVGGGDEPVPSRWVLWRTAPLAQLDSRWQCTMSQKVCDVLS